MHTIWAVLTRHLLLLALFFLPQDRKLGMERRLRGKEEYRKLRLADWVLVSWGKSGRTWFRVMLSRLYQVKYGLPMRHLLEYDNLHRKNPAVPRVLFSHNNYMRDYLDDWKTLNHFRGKKIVLLVRDPRDVAVSQYFQWKYRMRPHKKLLNEYPPHGKDVSIFDFVTDSKVGVPRIVDFFNGWAEVLSDNGNVQVIRYEDMRKNPRSVLKTVLEFVGTPGTEQEIAQAVEFASYENMKKMEEKKFFRGSGARVRPGDRKNPQSFKVRRAKVGGYRDYFDDKQLAALDTIVEDVLNPVFGYKGKTNDEVSRSLSD
ncbi:MAG: sulfotransferase domain-containing protein [Gammaproteobacteria bacterium]